MLQIEKVKERIQELEESEAKSMLLLIYARLDTAINGRGGDEFIKQTVNHLYKMYLKLPESQKFVKERNQKMQCSKMICRNAKYSNRAAQF